MVAGMIRTFIALPLLAFLATMAAPAAAKAPEAIALGKAAFNRQSAQPLAQAYATATAAMAAAGAP